MCPWEIPTEWSDVVEGPGQRLIVAQSPGPVQCARGLPVVPHVSFADCPPLDYLLVPGGQGARTAVHNQILLNFVSA